MPHDLPLTFALDIMALFAVAAFGVVLNTVFPNVVSLRRTVIGSGALWISLIGCASVGRGLGYW